MRAFHEEFRGLTLLPKSVPETPPKRKTALAEALRLNPELSINGSWSILEAETRPSSATPCRAPPRQLHRSLARALDRRIG